MCCFREIGEVLLPGGGSRSLAAGSDGCGDAAGRSGGSGNAVERLLLSWRAAHH